MDKSKPIIALDFPSKKNVTDFLALFQKESLNVKVGMELFYQAGPNLVSELVQQGHEVFLDLKLYDIPHTVQRAMAQLAKLGVSMVNVHASGGQEMMRAALTGLKEGAVEGKKQPLLIAVTQLTSRKDEITVFEQQLAVSQEENILHLAKLTAKSGLDGVVCSPWEATQIKKQQGEDFLTITPGVRLQEQVIQSDDQKRVMTPKKAAKNGSDYIVVGRPITQAKDPIQAYRQVLNDWLEGKAIVEGEKR